MIPAPHSARLLALVEEQLNAHGVLDPEQRKSARAVAINVGLAMYELAQEEPSMIDALYQNGGGHHG